MHAGEDAARDCLLEAVALAEQLDDSDLLGRAALSLGGFGLSPGIVDDELVGGARGGARGRRPGRQRAAGAAARAPRRRDLLEPAARPARGARRRGLAIARRLGDPATLAFVLDQGRIATSGPDHLERELAWVHELFALSEQLGDHESAVRARVTHIDLLLELDDLPAADMAIATLDRIATDVRDPRARSYIPLHRARRALMEGRAEEAERLIDEGVKLALEPARLDRPDPRGRAAVLRCAARRAASASSRTPSTSSPTASRRCPRGAARSRCSTSTTGARARRGASSSTSPPAASRTSRATTSGWSRWRCSPSSARASATASARA